MNPLRKISERYTWRVWIIAWYVAVLTVGIAAICAGPFVSGGTDRLLAALPVGASVGFAVFQTVKLHHEIRWERLRMYLPEQTEWLNEDDDEQRVAVTRGNGEQLIVTLPKGYHPAQDGGLALAEAACPNMPKGLRKAWKDAAMELALRRLLEDERE